MDNCEARAGESAHLRIAMGWGGAFVGCGSCSSRGVTATVQMRSAGSVRFMTDGGCSTLGHDSDMTESQELIKLSSN